MDLFDLIDLVPLAGVLWNITLPAILAMIGLLASMWCFESTVKHFFKAADPKAGRAELSRLRTARLLDNERKMKEAREHRETVLAFAAFDRDTSEVVDYRKDTDGNSREYRTLPAPPPLPDSFDAAYESAASEGSFIPDEYRLDDDIYVGPGMADPRNPHERIYDV